jgi:uncharacterized protein
MNETPNQPPAPQSPNPVPTLSTQESQMRTWNMLCHLGALAGFIIPFGSVLGPLIIWQIKKNEIPSVEAHGKAALNFQLTVLIATLGCVIVGFILSFILIGFLLFPVAIAIGICGLVFAIIAGLKANEGKDYRYPYSFNLIK